MAAACQGRARGALSPGSLRPEAKWRPSPSSPAHFCPCSLLSSPLLPRARGHRPPLECPRELASRPPPAFSLKSATRTTLARPSSTSPAVPRLPPSPLGPSPTMPPAMATTPSSTSPRRTALPTLPHGGLNLWICLLLAQIARLTAASSLTDAVRLSHDDQAPSPRFTAAPLLSSPYRATIPGGRIPHHRKHLPKVIPAVEQPPQRRCKPPIPLPRARTEIEEGQFRRR